MCAGLAVNDGIGSGIREQIGEIGTWAAGRCENWGLDWGVRKWGWHRGGQFTRQPGVGNLHHSL